MRTKNFGTSFLNAIQFQPELIRKYGYPCEEHRVHTADGYILTLHRIPGSPTSAPRPRKPVAFLQHGVLDSSAAWILMGPQHGLAYLLADRGYDVWLGNARGNRYSRAHREHNPDGGRRSRRLFWRFSWHEIGTVDVPAMLDYVLEGTGTEQVHYVGHSQGTTAFWVMCSQKPEYNARIRSMNALAPIAYLGRVRSPFLRAMTLGLDAADAAASVLGVYEFMPNTRIMRKVGRRVCNRETPLRRLCSNVLFLLGGFNAAQLNESMLPVILGHVPAGASTQQMVHYGQLIQSGRFAQYDDGWLGNRVRYGSFRAPEYDLANVQAPVVLHYSLNDWLADERDVQRLVSELGNVKAVHLVEDRLFNHFDFLWGLDARRLVYERVVKVMQRFEGDGGLVEGGNELWS